jgi:hypothetical protein
MSKVLLIILVVFVVGASFFIIKDSKNLYKAMPIDITKSQVTNLENFKFENWKEFNANNGEFKVLIPTLPQHANDTVKDPKTQEVRKYEMYVSEKPEGTIFMITMITFPPNSSTDSSENVLTKVMNDMVQANPKNKLKNMKVNDFKEMKALDFTIENDQINIDGKAFMVGDTLYVLT